MEDRGQVVNSAAEVYDEFFVPALFAQFAARVADAAHIRSGQRVLDVACGTGILTRTIAERGASVIGLDVNEGMLAVAARKAPQIEWRQGRAEALPFDDHTFDAVVSQFGLMFFEDRRAALREMMRVLRPGGRLAVAVWDALDTSPGYAAMADLLQKLFGDEAANGLRAPFVLGIVEELRTLFSDAGIPQAEISTHTGTARFPSLQSWVFTEIKGWVLADRLDDEQFARLSREAERALTPFVTANGSVAFAAPVHIVTAAKA
jgi:ubiquinone/menaquinone biosynthesis C-methylase UbiE